MYDIGPLIRRAFLFRAAARLDPQGDLLVSPAEIP